MLEDKKLIKRLDKMGIILCIVATVSLLSSLLLWLQFDTSLKDWGVFFVLNGLKFTAYYYAYKILKELERSKTRK